MSEGSPPDHDHDATSPPATTMDTTTISSLTQLTRITGGGDGDDKKSKDLPTAQEVKRARGAGRVE